MHTKKGKYGGKKSMNKTKLGVIIMGLVVCFIGGTTVAAPSSEPRKMCVENMAMETSSHISMMPEFVVNVSCKDAIGTQAQMQSMATNYNMVSQVPDEDIPRLLALMDTTDVVGSCQDAIGTPRQLLSIAMDSSDSNREVVMDYLAAK